MNAFSYGQGQDLLQKVDSVLKRLELIELSLTRQGMYGTRCRGKVLDDPSREVDGHIVEIVPSDRACGVLAIVWSDNKLYKVNIEHIVFDM